MKKKIISIFTTAFILISSVSTAFADTSNNGLSNNTLNDKKEIVYSMYSPGETSIEKNVSARIPVFNGDVAYAPNGGTWKPNDINCLGKFTYYWGKTYLSYEQTTALYKAKINISPLKDALRYGGTAAASAVAAAYGLSSGTAGWLVGLGIAGADWIVNNLDAYYFQQAVNASSDGKIVITTTSNYNVAGYYITTNIYEPWGGSYIYGKEGISGYFDLSNRNPVFIR